MAKPFSYEWTRPALRVAAAGFGAAVAGPLGGALGVWFAALGAADLIEKYAEKWGEKAGEKLFETATDLLAERLKGPSVLLEGVYSEALRLSLGEIRSSIGRNDFDDWFANWESCLTGSIDLKLSSIVPITPDQIVPQGLNDILKSLMERLDAQGGAIQRKSLSLDLRPRPIPDVLLSELHAKLPERIQENFSTL